MKDKIEISKIFDEKGNEIIKFYLHCDLGVLWLFNKPFSIGIYDYFRNARSAAELHSYKHTSNEKLNKIVDRMPSYIKYAKQLALEDRAYESVKEQVKCKKKVNSEDLELAA